MKKHISWRIKCESSNTNKKIKKCCSFHALVVALQTKPKPLHVHHVTCAHNVYCLYDRITGRKHKSHMANVLQHVCELLLWNEAISWNVHVTEDAFQFAHIFFLCGLASTGHINMIKRKTQKFTSDLFTPTHYPSNLANSGTDHLEMYICHIFAGKKPKFAQVGTARECLLLWHDYFMIFSRRIKGFLAVTQLCIQKKGTYVECAD